MPFPELHYSDRGYLIQVCFTCHLHTKRYNFVKVIHISLKRFPLIKAKFAALRLKTNGSLHGLSMVLL